MPGFKDDIAGRREASAQAKKATLEQFRARQAREQEAAQLVKAHEETKAAEKQRKADEAVKRAGEQKAARDARYATRKARRL